MGRYRQPVLGEQLSGNQQQQIQSILTEFQSVFSDTPGRTKEAEIKRVTGDAAPVHLPPYSLPRARQDVVKNEVKTLLEAGIIEPSNSP